MSKIADKVVDVCQFCHIYYEDKVDEGSLDLYNTMETESTKKNNNNNKYQQGLHCLINNPVLALADPHIFVRALPPKYT